MNKEIREQIKELKENGTKKEMVEFCRFHKINDYSKLNKTDLLIHILKWKEVNSWYAMDEMLAEETNTFKMAKNIDELEEIEKDSEVTHLENLPESTKQAFITYQETMETATTWEYKDMAIDDLHTFCEDNNSLDFDELLTWADIYCRLVDEKKIERFRVSEASKAITYLFNGFALTRSQIEMLIEKYSPVKTDFGSFFNWPTFKVTKDMLTAYEVEDHGVVHLVLGEGDVVEIELMDQLGIDANIHRYERI